MNHTAPSEHPFASRLARTALAAIVCASAVACPVVSAAGAPPTVPPGAAPLVEPPFPDATLAFADEFDGTTLDEGRWNRCHWWNDQGCTIVTNDELQWYVPEQVAVADGLLRLTVAERSIVGTNGIAYDYVSGMVSSGPPVYRGDSKFAFTYGTVEARINAPAGEGHWAALWLLAASSYHLPEIDVVEILGIDPAEMVMSFHPLEGTGDREQVRTRLAPEELDDGWVTLRLDWYPGQIVWWVNGVERFRYEGDNVPDEPLYVIVNLAEGGTPGPPSADTPFPSSLLVDYVRVWQG